MKRITSTFAAFAIAAMFTAVPATHAAQDPAPQPAPEQQPAPEPQPAPEQPQSQDVSTATGELTKVDPDAMTLTLKGADGQAWTFRYTEDTEVTGAQETVAGLATQAGTVVTVHFEGEGEARTATKIVVAE